MLLGHAACVADEVPLSSYLWSFLGGSQTGCLPEYSQHLLLRRKPGIGGNRDVVSMPDLSGPWCIYDVLSEVRRN